MAPDQTRITLSSDQSSARDARRFIDSTLADWEMSDLDETAELLVTELVTNAVLHARTPVDVVARRAGRQLRVEVHDGDRNYPSPKPFSPVSSGGRGLQIVEALASRWGVTTTDQGKCVWFELDGAHKDATGSS